jgi:ComF family protein
MTHPGCKTKYSLDGLTSFFRYDGIVKEAIKRIKYGYAYDIAGELVDSIPSTSVLILTKLLISKHLSFSLVPIPLHTSRFRARGFNQADIVGRAFSHRLSLPLNTHIIIRAINTMPQVQMKDREKRLSNMKNVFAMKNPAIKQCNNRAIVLVDDVFTTGATLRSAASVLKHSGVPFVWGITLAQ